MQYLRILKQVFLLFFYSFSAFIQDLRIEIHILRLQWMMKNISYFNVCEALRVFRKHFNS